MQTIIRYTTRGDRDIKLAFPARFAVCCRCRGTGKHVNPSIDGHGLGAEDFADEDFREAYFAGDYDVVCHECRGERVVEEIDDHCLSRKQQAYLGAVERAAHEDAKYAAECAAERRMGA